jgi:hypothetical protein
MNTIHLHHVFNRAAQVGCVSGVLLLAYGVVNGQQILMALAFALFTLCAVYHRRLGALDTMTQHRTFTDPAFVAAAGIDVPLSRRVSVRPDVRGMWVVRDGHAYQMVLVGLQLAYHIEDHPVTPSRSTR